MAIITINGKVGQGNLVSIFFDALLSTDDSRKKLAINAVLIALPDDGPDLVRIVSSSAQHDGMKNYAEKSLDERRNKLISQMFSADPIERLEAFNNLFAGWKNNIYIIPRLINYPSENNKNPDGIYISLVFLSQMDRNAVILYSRDINIFSRRFDFLGLKIKGRGKN